MRRPGFTGAGLDRADLLRLDPERLAELAALDEARLLRLSGLDPAIEPGGELRWSTLDGSEIGSLIFLGLDGGRPLFAPLVEPVSSGPASAAFRVIGQMPPREAAIWAAARSLNQWHHNHHFCGRCGGENQPCRAGWGRRCSRCGAEHFPRVDPVVIMLTEHEERVLVARQPAYPPGRYSALAGFVEPGESIEEAVAREMMEEAGLEVDDVSYVASQPWPFPGQLMIACLARARDGRLRIDTTELEDAFWVDRAGVAAALAGEPRAPFRAPPAFAIAAHLLEYWLARSEPADEAAEGGSQEGEKP